MSKLETNSRGRLLAQTGRNSKLLRPILLLCLAFIFNLAIVYYYRNLYNQPQETGNSLDYLNRLHDQFGPDVKSALRRAKTDKCKREFMQFALVHPFGSAGYGPPPGEVATLKRTCPLDNNAIETISPAGCTNPNPIQDNNTALTPFVTIDEKADSSNQCNHLCFIYGHTFAGFQPQDERCFCSDSQPKPSIPCDNESQQILLKWNRVNNGIYRPKKKGPNNNKSQLSRQRPVRIAFLLSLNGRSILQVRRLLKSIYSTRHIYYIHVDLRQYYLYDKLTELSKRHSNIYFSSQRYETIWGGTALLSMMLNAMEDLKHFHWDYLINLSESDFPLKSLVELQLYIASQSYQSIYLKSHSMKGYNFAKKQGLNYNFYQCEGRVWRLDKRQLPTGIIYSGGSDWFGLPRSFCDFILANKDKPSTLVNSLRQLYNFTLLPAESFFHTLAMNSEFCDKIVDNNLRITNWHRKKGCKCQHKNVVDWCGCSPLVYRWSDWSRLELTKSSPSLFFSRKFDPTICSSVIVAVENNLIYGLPTKEPLDTRYWINVEDSSYSAIPQAYEQFGMFIQRDRSDRMIESRLESIDQYFNEDKFVGLILRYCDVGGGPCRQFLVAPLVYWREQAADYFNTCYMVDKTLHLERIEINHSFDIGERQFRNHMPLLTTSDVAVHHEWLVAANNQDKFNRSSQEGEVLFGWLDPKLDTVLVQEAKLKRMTKPNRLSLVHRLDISKPLESGIWTLYLLSEGQPCSFYQFAIFNESSFTNQHIPEKEFGLLHTIEVCAEELRPLAQNYLVDCKNFRWSLTSRDARLRSYEL